MVKVKLLKTPTRTPKNNNLKCVVSDGKTVFYFFCSQDHKEAHKVTQMEPGKTFIIPEQDSPRGGGSLWLKKENRFVQHCVAMTVPDEVISTWFHPQKLTTTEILRSPHKRRLSFEGIVDSVEEFKFGDSPFKKVKLHDAHGHIDAILWDNNNTQTTGPGIQCNQTLAFEGMIVNHGKRGVQIYNTEETHIKIPETTIETIEGYELDPVELYTDTGRRIKKVKETIESNSSYKAAKRKLASGKSQLIALNGEDGRLIHDRDQIITHVKDYYQNLYSSKVCVDPPTITVDTDDDIPPVGADEVAKALKEMKRGKAPGNDEILVWQEDTSVDQKRD